MILPVRKQERCTPESVAAQTPDWLANDPGWPWALYVGGKFVTSYATRQEAEDAKEWYVRTFGEPQGELVVRDLNEATA